MIAGGSFAGAAELAASVAEIRRALAAGAADAAERLEELASRLGDALADAQGGPPSGWLALLDELELLVQAVEREQAAIERQAWALNLRRQAGRAYRPSGERP